MLNSYKDYNRIIICFVIFCFLGGLLGVQLGLLIKDNIAYADYTEDVLNNPNVLVNFNQYSKISSVSSGSVSITNYSVIVDTAISSYATLSIDYFEVNTNRLYYVFAHGSNYTSQRFTYAYNGSDRVNCYRDGIFDFNNNYGVNEIWLYNDFPVGETYFGFIDLTQMFGAGNEPNLQQCRDLFIADYYSYNTGSAVSLSGINAYVEGYNDAMSTLDVVYNSADLYPSLFSYQTTVFRLHEGSVYFNGIVGLPLGMTLLPNDLITLDFRAILIDTSTTIDFGYLIGSNFVTIASYTYDYFTDAHLRRYGIVSFSIPVNMNTLYIRVLNSSTPDSSACICGTFYLNMRTSNAYSGLKENFDLGYAKAQQYYEKLYARGGTQWTAIYQEGYYAYPNDEHYTFRDLITAAVDTPVQAMTNLFDFDILGVNMKTFYLSVFTLCVIFMILKLVL